VWGPLLKQAKVTGTFHMLRHFFVTALIQSGVNAKVAQTLAGHHSTSFALDQYADAVVAAQKVADSKGPQLIEFSGAPGGIRTPDPLVRSSPYRRNVILLKLQVFDS
jgi:hypothetical protein